jgi:hypothetical protein
MSPKLECEAHLMRGPRSEWKIDLGRIRSAVVDLHGFGLFETGFGLCETGVDMCDTIGSKTSLLINGSSGSYLFEASCILHFLIFFVTIGHSGVAVAEVAKAGRGAGFVDRRLHHGSFRR